MSCCSDSVLTFSFQLICRWKQVVIGHSARTLGAYFAITFMFVNSNIRTHSSKVHKHVRPLTSSSCGFAVFAVQSRARPRYRRRAVLPRRAQQFLESRPVSELREFLTCRGRVPLIHHWASSSFAGIHQTTAHDGAPGSSSWPWRIDMGKTNEVGHTTDFDQPAKICLQPTTRQSAVTLDWDNVSVGL